LLRPLEGGAVAAPPSNPNERRDVVRDIKAALAEGEVLIGPFSVSASPTLVETIGYAGFDFVLIDCEHAATSPFGTELEGLVRAAYAADIAPIVRVTRNDRGQILKALNFGAKAVVVPHVNTPEDAKEMVSAAHYAPLGRRSCAPPVRAAKHGFVDWSTHYQKTVKDTLVIPILEEVEAIENAEAIASVEGVGALFFGPFDLAVSMGLPDSVFDPTVHGHRKSVYDIARAQGIPAADLAWDVESATEFIRLGAQLIALGTDLTIFANSCRELSKEAAGIKKFVGVS
jgi:4-hydroxy-2-oxoheptanedioate aldolase